MNEIRNTRKFDLEARTLLFAKDVILFADSLPKTMPNIEISRQVIRAADSVGANYIEANESLGKKGFLMKIRISRKEAKESRYRLQLVVCNCPAKTMHERLSQEATELTKIFAAVLRNSMNADGLRS